MSEQAPRSLEERTEHQFSDVEDYVKEDIAAQRKEQAMAVYNGDRAGAKNASARARRREDKLGEMQDLQAHLGAMDTIGKHERVEATDSVTNLVREEDQEQFDIEAKAMALSGAYTGDVFYNDANQTVVAVGESRMVGQEEVVRVTVESKLSSGKTKKSVREIPKNEVAGYVDSLQADLIEPGVARLSAAENTSEYASDEPELIEDEESELSAEPMFAEGSHILIDGEEFKVVSVGELTDQAERAVILQLAGDESSPLIPTNEHALHDIGASLVPEASSESASDSIPIIVTQEGEAQTITVEQTPAEVMQSTDALLEEIAAADAAEQVGNPNSVYHRLQNWWADRRAQALAAGTMAALGTAERFQSTDEDGNEKKRRWVKPVVAIGIAAVGFAAWKYGVQPRLNSDTATTAHDVHKTVAAAGGGHNTAKGVEKLSKHGDTIWRHAKEYLTGHGVKHPSDAQVEQYTAKILKVNHLTWAKARELPVGYGFKMPRIK